MAAALLTPDTVILHNIPYVRDIITQRRLLEDIGATVLTPELRTHKITAAHVELFEAPYELVRRCAPQCSHLAITGSLWQSKSLAARRLRDRHAPDRSASRRI